jgi:hypothetical protein
VLEAMKGKGITVFATTLSKSRTPSRGTNVMNLIKYLYVPGLRVHHQNVLNMKASALPLKWSTFH